MPTPAQLCMRYQRSGKQSDADAFVRSISDSVARCCASAARFAGRNRLHLIEEAMQTTIQKLLARARGKGFVVKPKTFNGYVARVAYRTTSDCLQKRWNCPAVAIDYSTLRDTRADDPCENAKLNEIWEFIRAKLKPEECTAIGLCLDGYSRREVAEILGITHAKQVGRLIAKVSQAVGKKFYTRH